MLAHRWPATLIPSNNFRFPFLHKLNKPDAHCSIKIQYLYYFWIFSYLLACQGAMLQICVKLGLFGFRKLKQTRYRVGRNNF